MRLDTKLSQYLPDWYREILDYQQLCLAEEAQFEALAQWINAVHDNLFFSTMDEAAVTQWESVFGILADASSETLDFRRARLLNRISLRPPFTLSFLYQKLDELIGPGQWKVTIDYANYALYVESSARSQQYAQEVSYTIGKIKPAHIVFRNVPFLEYKILVSETVELTAFSYHYQLGGWGIGLSPFADKEDKGVIKTAEISSVQPYYLNSLAAYSQGQIAKARLNGSVLISPLTVMVSDSMVTVEYTVNPSDADTITRVELLTSGNQALTDSTVYVPVVNAVTMKHEIPIVEGVDENA